MRLSSRALEDRLRDAHAAAPLDEARNRKKPQEDTTQLQQQQQEQHQPVADVVFVSKEIERLRRERRAVVEGSAGALDEESDVVRCLDARISDLVEQLRTRGHSMQTMTG
ncbi:hypothetical protein DQ04_19161000 [Trypanosoma grayi]|uniref:hypothetical protein n=1 Tax=Trypanosoma grayi TaxID=71804 RepID=UPI0004F40D56|nr:hypothetical protein DQ04_19161000 [Trypanosoma grayi]KEG05705.1 hypothetical protein DQ04_19161000 [Trypanosoma grayi]